MARGPIGPKTDMQTNRNPSCQGLGGAASQHLWCVREEVGAGPVMATQAGTRNQKLGEWVANNNVLKNETRGKKRQGSGRGARAVALQQKGTVCPDLCAASVRPCVGGRVCIAASMRGGEAGNKLCMAASMRGGGSRNKRASHLKAPRRGDAACAAAVSEDEKVNQLRAAGGWGPQARDPWCPKGGGSKVKMGTWIWGY